jgi:predicted small metal-binding protein
MTRQGRLDYEFACKNLYPECDTRIQGDSEAEVLDMAKRHIREHHGVREYQDDVVKNLRTWIRPAV